MPEEIRPCMNCGYLARPGRWECQPCAAYRRRHNRPRPQEMADRLHRRQSPNEAQDEPGDLAEFIDIPAGVATDV